MEKILLFVLSFIVFTSCTDTEELIINQQQPAEVLSTRRSYTEALDIAQRSILMLNGDYVTRTVPNMRRIDTNETKVIRASAMTRSFSSNIDTLIYVFNFENDEGFALVSASKNTEGLLAVTEKGHLNPNEQTGIGGFDILLENAKKYVLQSAIPPIEPIDSMISINVVDCELDSIVGPYLSVRWGQGEPEGLYFPNYIAGCANTAMAQIMSYYNFPETINLTYNKFERLALNWPAMKTHHNSSHTVSDCNDATTHAMIGKLCRQLGKMNNSKFSLGSTNTQTDLYGGETLNTIGYNVGGWRSYSSSYVKSQLNQKHLLLMIGQLHGASGGHVWVLDGYRIIGPISYLYKKIGNGEWFLDDVIDRTVYYNHINWGFYGSNNGYYADNIFNMALCYDADTDSNDFFYNFDWRLKILSVYK